MEEVWRPVPTWEEFYEVSDLGRVRSLDRMRRCNGGKRVPVAGRVLSPGVVQGYLQVHMQRAPRREQRKVHSLVLEAFVGPCPPGQEARHLNGKRADCCLENLCWGTKLENAQDKRRHGTMCQGETVKLAKLTESDVRAIRETYSARRATQVELAERFGVAQTKISAVVRRETWKHVA